MTITDQHFEALQHIRNAAEDLRLACIEVAGTGAFLHMAYDHEIKLTPTDNEAASLGKLRAVK